MAEAQSALEYLASELNNLGLGTLADTIWDMIEGQTVRKRDIPAELRKSTEYVKRFPANKDREKAGLRPLTPAEYLQKEEDYRELMQNYGLPDRYYIKSDPLSSQPTFDKLIAGNVDNVTLERKLIQAVDEIQNKPTEYLDAIKTYYPEIQRGDLIAYVLDPKNTLPDIKTKVAAAQIGGEYLRAGAARPGVTGAMMTPTAARAEELARAGVTAERARTVAQTLPEAERGTKLAAMQGAPEYGQEQIEEEFFGLGGAAQARRRRQDIAARERALYEGKTGVTGGALARERAGQF